MLNRPVLSGKIGKWLLGLIEFNLVYFPQKSVKGQALADFLADHPTLDIVDEKEIEILVCRVEIQPWIIKFDGSSTEKSAGAGVVITSPEGTKTALSFNLDFECTNNQAENEALIIGLQILQDLGAKEILVIGDSQLVLKQLMGEYKCTSISLTPYYTSAIQLVESFDNLSFMHVPRELNWEADELSQVASSLRLSEDLTHKFVFVQKRNYPSILERGIQVETLNIDMNLAWDWCTDIKAYLENPAKKVPFKVRAQALNYVLLEGYLFRRTLDGLLLRCVAFPEAMEVLKQVHEGICGAHQVGRKMRWLIRRHGYYWPTMLEDCIQYAKGCQQCQRYRNIQRIPADDLYPVVKPWPFRGWAIDLIGKIYPASSKGHSFIIVATDYFTKWVEAIPMKKVEQKDVISFIKEYIIHRFGIPQTIITDQGTMFTEEEMKEFAEDYNIKLLNSTPHYAQANGQAEASNKILIGILEKLLEDNPRDWLRILSETLWAYRSSKREATSTSPFALTYGHDAILPVEVSVPSLRVARQNSLTPGQFSEAILMELEEVNEERLKALTSILAQKTRISRL